MATDTELSTVSATKLSCQKKLTATKIARGYKPLAIFKHVKQCVDDFQSTVI